MIWATVSSQSCFCWLYRPAPSLAAKNIINLILLLTIWWCPCVESSLVLLEEGVAMTSAFSWQNSISLCPASFCTPRPNLPVTPSISLLPTFAFQSPVMKRTSFWGVSFIELFNFSFFSITGQGIDLDYCDFEWFALETNRDHSVIFEIASKYYISDSFVVYDGYSISSKGFLPTVVDIMVIWVKFTHSSQFSSLIPKMSKFTLAISCLTTSNLPWFMDLTFQVPMQYCSLQHHTLLLSPVTSTTRCCFCSGSVSLACYIAKHN